jgi:hypothetical protein
MKKQTAVEWLMDKLPTIDKNDPYYEDIIQQAKAMEKEQISQAYTTGVEEDVYTNPLRTGEMYYNETYKP